MGSKAVGNIVGCGGLCSRMGEECGLIHYDSGTHTCTLAKVSNALSCTILYCTVLYCNLQSLNKCLSLSQSLEQVSSTNYLLFLN